MGLAADGHRAFLHGLEQRGLHLGRRAVDFVGQHHVGEDGALVGGELAGLGREDHGADHVGGEQIGRELDAAAFDAEGLAHRADQKGLGQSGHAFNEHVAIREQGDQQLFNDLFLTEHRFGDFDAQLGGPFFAGGRHR
jgi:hypothetical protein